MFWKVDGLKASILDYFKISEWDVIKFWNPMVSKVPDSPNFETYREKYFHHGWRKLWHPMLSKVAESLYFETFRELFSPWLNQISRFGGPKCPMSAQYWNSHGVLLSPWLKKISRSDDSEATEFGFFETASISNI